MWPVIWRTPLRLGVWIQKHEFGNYGDLIYNSLPMSPVNRLNASRSLFIVLLLPTLLVSAPKKASAAATQDPSANRVASIFVSQDFINEQLAAHVKSDNLKEAKIALDPDHGQIFMRGKILIPLEELRALNLDPRLGAYRFQVTIKPETTGQGHLILEFPLAETFFYPADSKDPVHERVVVPVQLLSLGLASVRGYLAALSGDFSSFSRRTKKLTALVKGLDHAIAHEKNPDTREDLINQRSAAKLQLAAVPIEAKQLQTLAKEYEHILGFTGEKELNINDELGARKNALILKIKLSQLAPFLEGVELGGVRILLDKKDGGGEKYLSVDVNSSLESSPQPKKTVAASARPGMKSAPSLILRLNQSLFESTAVVEAEKKEMASTSLRGMTFQLKDDGLHVEGQWHKFLFTIGFDTIVDFVTVGVDAFEVRVRDIKVAGIDVEFLSKFVLETLKKRLDKTLKGICSFTYVGTEKDHSRALRVSVNPGKLVPAFPDLHLVAVDVREGEFLLKIGRP